MGVPESPLFRIGVIADVQYCDFPDGLNFLKTRRRYYRGSKLQLKQALESLGNIDCLLQLGDLIDAHNGRLGIAAQTWADLVSLLNSFGCPIFHTIGNHEACCFGRADPVLYKTIDSKENGFSRPFDHKYCFSVTREFGGASIHIVSLDCYDISMLGHTRQSRQYKEAEEVIRSVNSNKNPDDGEGLKELRRRFRRYNGIVGRDQVAWLKRDLDETRIPTIVIGHGPICPGSCQNGCLIMNYEEVLGILNGYSHVIGYFAGHDHDGGLAVRGGIVFITVPGMIERPPEENSYLSLEGFEDRIRVRNFGNHLLPETYNIFYDKTLNVASRRSSRLDSDLQPKL